MAPSNVRLVRAAEAEVLAGNPHAAVTLLADASQTDGALTTSRGRYRDGAAGAPPHLHARSSELCFVLDGSLDVLLGEQVTTLHSGDVVVVPPGVPHAFAATSGADADVLLVFAPGTPRFDYYRLLDRVARGQADAQELLDSAAAFDNHYVDSAAWSQARSK